MCLLFLSRNFNKDFITSLNKKEEPLYFLYPLIAYCSQWIKSSKNNKAQSERKRIFQELYIGNAPKMQIIHFYRKVSLAIVICGMCILFAVVLELPKGSQSNLVQDNQLPRPAAGEGGNSVWLEFFIENGYEGNLEFQINEKKLEGKEVEFLFEEVKEYIDRKILGDNKSTSEVTSNLNLMTSIPHSSATIKWSVSDPRYINSQGTINNEEITGDGVLVQIEAEITYYEHQIIYSQYINILPKIYSEEEQLHQSLKEALMELDKSTRTEDMLPLPDKVGDHTLSWKSSEKSTGIQLIFLGGLASILVIVGMESSLRNKRKLRNLQMLIDYPDLVCKFTLLLNAGMTIRGAFERIALDYKRKREREINNLKKGEKEPRYAYEELLIAIRELEIGRPEAMVYDSFGQRCSLLCYLRFSTIIVQNMKKGTKGIVQMLEIEAVDAFSERKECAKRLGEEAGTKLLGPMVGMLFIVLLIVLVPAFINFSF